MSCSFCKKECPSGHNYCSWDCHVAEAIANGSEAYLPNGLPIQCITASGKLLECEHGDHPTYMFPVTLVYDGDPEDVTDRDETGKIIHSAEKQPAALIYTDGCIAVTMSECCYTMWHLPKNEFLGGSRWHKKYKLAASSLEKVLAASPSQTD